MTGSEDHTQQGTPDIACVNVIKEHPIIILMEHVCGLRPPVTQGKIFLLS